MLQVLNNFCAFLCCMEKDAYVLCRVFHKNNIGPPNGQRYAPFIEEEWDDDSVMVVPGLEPVYNDYIAQQPRDEGNGGVLCAERRNNVVQVSTSIFSAVYSIFVIDNLFCGFISEKIIVILYIQFLHDHTVS